MYLDLLAFDNQGSPNTASDFLKWRLEVVETRIRELSSEKAMLLSSRKTLEEDLNDIVTNKRFSLTDAYVTELKMSLDSPSSSSAKIPALKDARLDQKQFKDTVNEHLGAKKVQGDTEPSFTWCNVLGSWLPVDSVKCAPIVPLSFNTKDMAHMFGSDEPPLTSRRNGLSLTKKIEMAFDNCWIAIVPVESVDPTPTEWKVVLLNTAEKDSTFFTDPLNFTDRKIWRWRDIDGRKLHFRNDNRPARRFLYLRYILAWLHAEKARWPGFKEKLPSGRIWAGPKKSEGYLRKSVLLELAKKTGDKLPMDLIDSGVYEDPATSSVVYDEVAAIRVTELVQRHLGGTRDVEIDEDDLDD